jgi:hypothetical protein
MSIAACPAVGALIGGQGQPYPVADVEVLDAGSDGVHHAGAVSIGPDFRKRQRVARYGPAERLPVGGVHPGDHDPHTYLPAPRVADLAANEFKDRGVAGAVNDCYILKPHAGADGQFPVPGRPNPLLLP